MDQHPDPRTADDDDGGQKVTLHHSVHSPRRVDVRIHGARGHPLDPPVNGGDDLVRRIIWYAVAGIIMIAVAFGSAYYVSAKGSYHDCVDRNRNAQITDAALLDLAGAAEAGGDTEEAAVLNRFRARREKLPGEPPCNRPPFTREYPVR